MSVASGTHTEESEDSEEGTSCQAQGAMGTAQGISQRLEQLLSPLPPSGCQAPRQDRIPALTPTTTRVHASPSQPGAGARSVPKLRLPGCSLRTWLLRFH